MANWYRDGTAVENVSIDDRAYQYGDGLFETIAIRGNEPRLWDYHVQRLAKGCERLRIAMPDADELLGTLQNVLGKNKMPGGHCVAKIIVSAGSSEPGYRRGFAVAPEIHVGIFRATALPIEYYRQGVDTVLCETHLAINSVTAGLKTLNRIEQVIARSEFTDTAAFEGLTLDAADNVICGTMSNVFLVTNKKIVTPSLDQCGVEGVMRRHIMTTLPNNDLTIEMRPFRISDLESVDEIFLSNSQFGIVPVKSCDDFSWPVGGVTQEVMSIMAANGVAECHQ